MREERKGVREGQLYAASVVCLVAAFPVGFFCGHRIVSDPMDRWLVPYLVLFAGAAVLGFLSRWREGRTVGLFAILCMLIFGLVGSAHISRFRRAQTAEAAVVLRKVAESVAQKVSANEELRGLDAAWAPSARCCERGEGPHGRCSRAANAHHFRKQPWLSLGYAGPDHDYRYQYRIARRGSGYVIQAQGDNDCDGVLSLFEIEIAKDANETSHHGFIEVENEME